MKISVFGIGYVGAVSAACLADDGHMVVAVDVNPGKVSCLNSGRSPIVEPGLGTLISNGVAHGRLRATTNAEEAVFDTDLSLVCVGTPSDRNGSLDLGYVRRVCSEIGAVLRRKPDFHVVAIRSTMLPGSTRETVVPILEETSGRPAGATFGVALCPEFLREGSAIRDHRETSPIVLGVDDARSERVLRELFGPLPGELLVTDAATAEMVKYANNAWHATKIVFANEIGAICKANAIDGRRVMEIVRSDRRLNVSAAYMQPGFAFGGSCLPKDLRALNHRARSQDVESPMLNSLLVSNRQHVRRAVEMIEAAGSRRVGMLGLSFKPRTDDLRESPAVELAERLYGKGYDLRIFDRNVSMARLIGSNREFIETRIPHLATLLTEDLEALALHAETLVVSHVDDDDRRRLPRLRQGQVVIELNPPPPEIMPGDGRFDGICW